MKRSIILIVIAICIFYSVNILTAIAAPNLYINGVISDVKLIMKDGVAYAPIYPLASAMGLNVSWNPGLNLIKVNNEPVSAPAYQTNGIVYVPIEAVVQSIGGQVDFDGKNSAIKITFSGQVSNNNNNSNNVPEPTPTPTPKPIINDNNNNNNNNNQNNQNNNNTTVIDDNGDNSMPESFVPKSSSNGTFLVTITNVELTAKIKDYYKPKPGCKFVVTYLSQQNISQEVQTYTGKFTLLDNQGRNYELIEGLSNFWLIVLRPGGINFGYLVFEIPENSNPTQVALTLFNKNPIFVQL